MWPGEEIEWHQCPDGRYSTAYLEEYTGPEYSIGVHETSLQPVYIYNKNILSSSSMLDLHQASKHHRSLYLVSRTIQPYHHSNHLIPLIIIIIHHSSDQKTYHLNFTKGEKPQTTRGERRVSSESQGKYHQRLQGQDLVLAIPPYSLHGYYS